MALPSPTNHNFARAAAPRIQRSTFDRSCGHKTTFNAGKLIPFFLDEILPGDTMNLRATVFARLSTLIHPIMDNVHLDTFFFFVPCRILWDNWEKFNGAQTNPGDSIDFTIPILTADPLSFSEGTLADYFGIPTQVTFTADEMPNALPFRAYNKIWNDWFRSQELNPSVTVSTGDGPDSDANYNLLDRGKRHDYFTSCLLSPQRGDAVALPLGTSAPVIGNGETIGLTQGTNNFGPYATSASNSFSVATNLFGQPVGTSPSGTPSATGSVGLTTDPNNSGMIADLSDAIAATVNDMRQNVAIQQLLELDARGGTRYVEMIKAHFDVTVPDFRLQRSEFLGGHSQRVQVNSVPQTSASTVDGDQAGLAAYALAGSESGFFKSFVEHGYVLGLVNVRADLTYQQGLHRMWSRSTRYDFYLPTLAHLGEQAVLNKEIFFTSNDAITNADVFGYQERWAEYRYKPSMVTGAFRSNAATTLESWHLALDFASVPSLNAAFIRDNPDFDRILADNTEPDVLMDSYFRIRHTRPIPVYSIPGLDRF